MAIEKSWTGHSPEVSVNWSYDMVTQKVKVVWTCSSGYFKYSFFKFYIFFRHKVSGKWTSKNYYIGGMVNPSGVYNDIWASGSAEKKVPNSVVKNQTQVAFGMYCSAIEDGGNCYSNLGGGPTVATGWTKLSLDSKTPTFYVLPDYRFKKGETTYNNISILTNAIKTHWKVGGSVKIKKLACLIQEKWGSNDEANFTWVYPLDSPQTFDGDGVLEADLNLTQCLHGTVTSLLLPSQWYDIIIAVASATEKIADQWEDDSVSIRVRTREESPNVTFTPATAASTSVTINWSATFPTRGTGAPMNYINYSLHDDTASTTTTGVALAADDSQEVSWGQFTITGLTLGHTYTLTPSDGITQLDGIAIGGAYGCTFLAVAYPTLDAVWNMSDGSLVFGEPVNDASVNLRVGGTTAGVWSITASIGINTSAGVSWVASKAVDAGDNTISLNDTALDIMYRNINPSLPFTLYANITYSLPDGTLPGSITKNYTMYFKGNMKTVYAGRSIAAKAPRAKIWVGANGSHRAICWVGVGGIPRRTI